jgi:alpha-amylase/alpha-mannosidase (GH57 family)
MPPKARLAILWHMHQPCYRNPVSGKFDLPWLRLHALKDYLGMARIVEEFPSLRLTFNLVPSLLSQLEQYLQGASDIFSDLFRKPAADLAADEVQFLVRHFFSIQYENHIQPFRRYDLLYRKKMERLAHGPADPDWRQVFSTAELRDLQVWFQLAYTDESYRSHDPRVISLVRRGQNFSEVDKETLSDVESEILRSVVPEYRKLQDSGQVELSTSPFYHPILPLLLDPQAGRKANERLAPYDLDFNWEEDAWAQLQSGLDLMERTFGVRPRGIWPPEGGVSEATVLLLARAGIAWTASDEEVLSRSLPRPLERDARMAACDPGACYSPYTLAGLPLKIFFRDHLLSDLIGFYYQKFPAPDAAADLLGRIKSIAASSPEALTIPIILDGENAWEFYPHSGRDFLRAFYRLVCADPEIETVTFSQAAVAPARELARLKSGSWINGNFDIWIGDRDDQKAWELLKGARDAFSAEKSRLAPAEVTEAEGYLHAAQGSDWFWWYGKENYTPDIDIFDNLFRLNLQKIYGILGQPVPAALGEPIPASTPADRLLVVPPRDTMEARVDGEASDYFEWLDAGRVDILSYGGAMNIANPLVKTLYFGFDPAHVFLRIDTKKHARTYFENGFSLRLLLRSGAASWQGEIGFDGQAAEIKDLPPGSAGAVGRIIEWRVPLVALAIGEGGEFQLQMFWSFHGQPFQAIPAREPIALHVPDARDYAAYWQV